MKNFIIGILLLLSAFYLLWEQGQKQIEQQDRVTRALQSDKDLFDANISEDVRIDKPFESFSENNITKKTFPEDIDFEESLTEGLSNPFSTLVFTNQSGSIRQVMLKKHLRLSDDYNMSHSNEPMLSLSLEDESGRKLFGSLEKRKFEILNINQNLVVYKWEKPGELRIERHYSRENNQTYVFDHKTVLTNLSNDILPWDYIKLNLGSAFRMKRLYNPFDNAATYLNVGYYNDGMPLPEGCSCAECSGRIDGEKEEFFQLNEVGVNGKLEPRKLSKAKWACVNNQFFGFAHVLDTGNDILRIYNYNVSYNDARGTTVISTGQWYHLTAVFESNISKKLYLNGVLEATLTTNTAFPTGIDTMSLSSFQRGGGSPPGGYLDGNIACAMVYNKALTADEVSQNYNALKSRFNL